MATIAKDGRKKIQKHKSAVPLAEKTASGKVLDLSVTKSGKLDSLPSDFRERTDELRKLDLSGQNGLLRRIPDIRFAGHTLTWLSLAAMDCSEAEWMFLPMLTTLFGGLISKISFD